MHKNTALILIDIQQGFAEEAFWGGNRNNKTAEDVCARILHVWRLNDMPIIHVQHSSQNPSSKLHKTHEGFAFDPRVKPMVGEKIIVKQVNSAFIGTDLQDYLDENNIQSLVIVGLTTDHCVSTTARMAGNLDYDVLVISDATATFDKVGVHGEHFSSELIHGTALASLHDEFATVISSTQLFETIQTIA